MGKNDPITTFSENNFKYIFETPTTRDQMVNFIKYVHTKLHRGKRPGFNTILFKQTGIQLNIEIALINSFPYYFF